MSQHPLVGLLTIAVLWGLATLALGALAAVGWGVWPSRAGAVRETLLDRLQPAFILGLVNVLAYVVVVSLLHRAGAGRLGGLALLVWTVALAVSGLPGTAALLGQRIMAQAEASSPSTLRATAIGVGAVGAASMIPFVGWGLGLAFLLTCFGGGLMVFLRTLQGSVRP